MNARLSFRYELWYTDASSDTRRRLDAWLTSLGGKLKGGHGWFVFVVDPPTADDFGLVRKLERALPPQMVHPETAPATWRMN